MLKLDINNLINGLSFIKIADLIFVGSSGDNYYRFIPDTFKSNINKISKDKIIFVYTQTHWVNEFFQYIIGNRIDHKIVLITHNSDSEVNETIFLSKPENIIFWWSQNVNFLNEKLHSIPIGLENPIWFNHLNKNENIFKIRKEDKYYKNWVYMNHNSNTFPNERLKPYQLFNNEKWITSIRGQNGSNFLDYIKNVNEHRFMICPRGNGIDTHRHWESLYLKTYPISIKNKNISFYKDDLPILLIDEWEELNSNLLKIKFEEFVEKDKEYNWDILNINYWYDKIKNKQYL